MNRKRIMQSATAAAACALVAAAIGITTTAAAPSDEENGNGNGSNGPTAGPFPGPPAIAGAIAIRHRGAGEKGLSVIGGPPVHSEIVVPTRDGEDFQTVTQDSGTVESVSGNELTITEGTEEATYKTVTLEIPEDAKVLRNGEEVELGELKQGDRVHVSQSPEDSFVFATDEDFFEKAFHRRLGDLPRPPRLRDLPRPPRAGGLPPCRPVPMARRGS